MTLMNGSLSLESEKDKGSCFTLELPAGSHSGQIPKEYPLGKTTFPALEEGK
jgi:hypothetical protein